jgi:hypothetical protein
LGSIFLMPSSADLLDRGLDFKARADIVTRSPRLDDPHDRSHKKRGAAFLRRPSLPRALPSARS